MKPITHYEASSGGEIDSGLNRMDHFNLLFSEHLNDFNRALAEWVHKTFTSSHPGSKDLHLAVEYSVFGSGKRFRPLLALLTAEALGSRLTEVMPFAIAIEWVHSYSLIHDDLPCMDDDDFRRGRPTTHKIFSESTALLAGDALLTEAFGLIAKSYETDPGLALVLIQRTANAIGAHGMVGGQAIDLWAQQTPTSLSDLTHLHQLKTGLLIELAINGTALICKASLEQTHALAEFAKYLGLAFQTADDIIDANPKKKDGASLLTRLSPRAAYLTLVELSQNAHKAIVDLRSPQMLFDLIQFNLNRASNIGEFVNGENNE